MARQGSVDTEKASRRRPRSDGRAGSDAPRRSPKGREGKAAGRSADGTARRKAPGSSGPAGRRNQPRVVVRGGRMWRVRRWLFVPLLLLAGVATASLYALTQISLPPARPLAQTTFIYDQSGTRVLASYSVQNRVEVSLAQVPPIVVDAVVSTEDRHFFSEGAINPVSILRAGLTDLAGGGSLQGASTITQQYVKQTYLSSERTWSRKLKEAALAIKVSRTESKKQILEKYLNTIYWGRGAYGIEAAANAYFGEDVGHLGVREASLLAGLIREPDLADPARNPALARQNQDDTLRALVRDRHITQVQAAAVTATPFSSYVKPPPDPNLPAGAGQAGEAYFVEAVREQLIQRYGARLVDEGGLRVTTTLDPTLQSAAYDAVYGPGQLDPKSGTASGALVAVDDTGAVRAMVGGQDYRSSRVNLALGVAGGGGGRQPGSTFKAFMLAELIKLGYSPLSTFPAPPEVVIPHGNQDGTNWQVKNFKGESAPSPYINLITATAESVNTVYAQVVDKLGANMLDSMAASVGIAPSELHDYPSEVLGTDEVSPLEMAGAYATFANQGVYRTPILVSHVTDPGGRALPLPVNPTSRQVLTQSQANEETYVLQQVVLKGTGTAAGGVGSEVAGKTGTTENSANAWFIGYTPKLTAAVWMGYASGFRPMYGVQGGTIPAHIWHRFMASALSSEPQWKGNFAPVYSFPGMTLLPPNLSRTAFPLGMGSSTTSPSSSTSKAATNSTSTTLSGHSATTLATTPTSGSPPSTAPTPTTRPTPPTTTATPPPTQPAPPTTRP